LPSPALFLGADPYKTGGAKQKKGGEPAASVRAARLLP